MLGPAYPERGIMPSLDCNPRRDSLLDDVNVQDVFAPQTMDLDDETVDIDAPTHPEEFEEFAALAIHTPQWRPTGAKENNILHGLRPSRPTSTEPKRSSTPGLRIDGVTSDMYTMPPVPELQRSGTPLGKRIALSKPQSPHLSAIRGDSPSRPSTSGSTVSALKMQLDALHLGNNLSSRNGTQSPSVFSCQSDSDQTECYEVPLEQDFISAEVECTDDKKLDRKMSADDFEPISCLGKGAFGTVLLVKHKVSGGLYAQKQFRKASLTVHKKLIEQTKTERAILESVNRHPFVVKLYYAFQDHEKLYLILEYAQGGELFHHLQMEKMFPEDTASFYMAEMVLALEHLHRDVGVVYRDLKPENCLLDAEGHLLLTDFGLSKVAVDEDDRCNSSLGTVEYMAPEVVQGKEYGKACDWWSLGALGCDLLTGSPPFSGNNKAKVQEKIVKQKLNLPFYLTPDAKDLLTRLLRKDPKKRLGYNMSKDLDTIKKHRFFRKIDWRALARRELEPPIQPLITDPLLAENFSEEFTGLPLKPLIAPEPLSTPMTPDTTISATVDPRDVPHAKNEDPFGGFSFVAPRSLLDHGLTLAKPF
ncbi:serine/threonine protein kinase [Ascosphaera apis ARSEF 7405]|uniref:Serine/threonine protein kinase n=1 Tax=Ascosphaera apis ARSEF 7405 TaxID=392613 RepID=A0A162HZJ9_9EURO|nr:serine/threonine protein kinase [Ascosphaera apis ARSEF 7405]